MRRGLGLHLARRLAIAWALTLPAIADAKPGHDDAGRLLALGDSLLEAGDLDGAEAAYATVASWGWTSAALAHNRGLAALRAGRLGPAVAHLREARRLAPREPAVLQSLAAARAEARIAVRPAGSAERLMATASAPAGIVGLVLLAAASGLTAVLQRRRRKVAVVLALAAVVMWGVAGAAWMSAAPRATVLATAPLRAAPAASSAVLMELAAGRTLVVGQEHGAWVRARVPGGPAGWVPAHATVE